MVEIYITNFSTLPDPKDRKELMATLDPKRRLRIAEAASPKARRQCLASSLLLQKVLQEKGIDYRLVNTNRLGKPEVPGIFFNLSHSENLVVCAVSDREVGCDIEKLREAPRKVSVRFFSPQERGLLASVSGAAFDDAFFRLWTMKESYVKMTGEGLRVSMQSCEVVNDEESRYRICRDGKLQDCYVREYEIPGYCLSVCAEETSFGEVQWIRL